MKFLQFVSICLSNFSYIRQDAKESSREENPLNRYWQENYLQFGEGGQLVCTKYEDSHPPLKAICSVRNLHLRHRSTPRNLRRNSLGIFVYIKCPRLQLGESGLCGAVSSRRSVVSPCTVRENEWVWCVCEREERVCVCMTACDCGRVNERAVSVIRFHPFQM